MEGWIKIHRKMINWEWYADGNTLRLFIHLLLNANHADKKWQGITVKRGQIITGINQLKKDLKISIQSLRTSIKRLKSTNELTIKTSNKYSLITIVNYDLYQESETANKQTNKQLTIKQQTTNNQTTTNKNEKKVKNEKNIIPPTIEMIFLYQKKRGTPVDVNKFFNHYESKGWMIGKNKMKNWQAAYHTWEPKINTERIKPKMVY